MSWAQTEKVNARFEYHIQKTSQSITIDGIDNDEAWRTCEVAKDFYMVLPMDTSMAKVPTEIRMTYDQKNIYIQGICYHSTDTKYTVESLKRDFAFGKNDNFLLFIDTFDDQTNGFSFGVSAAGAQWDGTMYEGSKVDLSWDNKWVSAVKNYPDKWIFEMSIPFKTIRYKKGIMKWGINFSRLDLKTTEKSSWTPIPRQFATASLSHTGFLVWDETPPAPRMNVSLIPYVLGSRAKNFEKKTPVDNNFQAGMDAKVSLTSSLNLDLTVNPDFSQVDVDRQVTNLDRYELFFPERRQFFLENGDIFSNIGYATIRPFFSRRIGLGVPIDAGARLSGRINRNWRIGAMDMQTSSVGDSATSLPVQNFAVASVQRRLFARSNVGAFFINKQSLNYEQPTDGRPVYSMYNRNAGMEYNLASRDNRFTGKAMAIKSFSPTVKNSADNWVYAGHLQYFSRHWLTAMQVERVGRDYTAEVGYVPRVNFMRLGPQASYLFFPKGKYVLSHGPKVISSIFFDTNFNRTDDETTYGYTFNFRKLSILTVGLIKNYVKLLRPFDPTNSGLETLPTGSEHSWYTIGVDYTSRPQKLLTLTSSLRYGGYYADGTRLLIGGDLGYRIQPYVNILVSTTYNDIRLPEPWGRRPFWLISPRVDVTATNKLFFTTFLQYNEQTNNVNINARFQWRFKPASDIFIVYTDNYLPENWAVKSRAIVLKFTYWWNL
ncbi:MAG TPA: DUF5916 domain-containing protein [Cyclobacteriaceae bacterium]|nr:DUF5916 domain-containing protein [Cyclobacteriaceae bacterium]